MLHSIHDRYGEKLQASDGEIGHVKDFYFDDKSWTLRYLVADTGGWLAGRRVLISPHSLAHLYPEGKVLLVNLTRKQIEESPSMYEHDPVTRQQEEEYHRHYGYPYYAQSWPLWGLVDFPISAPLPELSAAEKSKLDTHLRSTHSVVGYRVETTDGVLGELADFMVDGRTWMIGEIVVECGHWYHGKKMMIPTDKVSRISYEDEAIFVDATKSVLREAALSAAS